MSERLNDLFTNTPCLTRSEMMAYLEGKLSGTALRQVELHLADCEFCTGAQEGLKGIDTNQVNAILERTDARINKAVQPASETRSFIKRLVAVAAVTVLLIVTSFFLNYYFSSHKVNISQKIETPASVAQSNRTEQKQKAESSNNDSMNAGSYTVNTAPQANGLAPIHDLEKKKQQQQVNTTATRSSSDKEELKPAATFKQSIAKNEGNSVSPAATPAPPVKPMAKIEIKEDEAQVQSYSYSASDKAEAVVTDNKSAGYLNEGEASYRNADYNGAIARFKKAIAINKADMEANYYAGLSEFKLNDYAKALTYFNNVLAVNGNAFYQQAQWQKAITLMQMGNNKDAQTLLTQIQLQNGMYKDSASQKLSELK